MYCQKCGKEISNNSKFCQDCGTPVGNSGEELYIKIKKSDVGNVMQLLNNNGNYKNPVFFILTIAVTIFVAIGGFLPLVSIDFFVYSREMNLLQLLLAYGKLGEELGAEEFMNGIFMGFLVPATICYLISVFFAVKMIRQLFTGQKVVPAASGMYCGVIYVAFLMVMVWAVNLVLEEELHGISSPLAITNNCWFLVIAPLLNLFVFFKGYIGDKKEYHYQEDNMYTL